jgi:hypothetical protein
MKKLIDLISRSADILDKIADSRGVARSTNIAILAQNLFDLSEEVGKLLKELEELRKFKEEHTEHDDKRNEVPAES